MYNLNLKDQNKSSDELSCKENIKGRFTRTTCKNRIEKIFSTKVVSTMYSIVFKAKKYDPIQILSR